MEEDKIVNKISGKETKWTEDWSLKFTFVSNKDKKKEIAEWLKQSCPFFLGLDFPDDIKIEISEEIDAKNRKILTTHTEDRCNFRNLIENKQKTTSYIYIIKSGNAFSWINYAPYSGRMEVLEKSEKKNHIKDLESIWINETVLVKKGISHKEVKKRGVTFEIFCKGDVIIPLTDLLSHVEFFDSFLAAGYGFPPYQHYLFPLSMPISIISSTPFEYKCTEPLVLIRIELDDFKKIFPSQDKFLTHILGYMSFKLFIERWKLLAQWTNKTDIKILCILSLYFSGALPLQNWKSLKIANHKVIEEEMNIAADSFEKPRVPITGFKVGPSELTLFVGLSRQDILKHITGGKSVFGTWPELTEIIKCESITEKEKTDKKARYYRFSATYPESYYTADRIRELIFSSLHVTKF